MCANAKRHVSEMLVCLKMTARAPQELRKTARKSLFVAATQLQFNQSFSRKYTAPNDTRARGRPSWQNITSSSLSSLAFVGAVAARAKIAHVPARLYVLCNVLSYRNNDMLLLHICCRVARMCYARKNAAALPHTIYDTALLHFFCNIEKHRGSISTQHTRNPAIIV